MKRFFNIIPPEELERKRPSFTGKIFFDIIPPERLEIEKPPVKKSMREAVIKIICISLIIGLNWMGLSAIYGTLAYFFDSENSNDNIYQTGILDFSILPVLDFSPEVTPSQSTLRNINTINEATLSFQYIVEVNNTSGILCDYLDLVADLDGENVYNGSLLGFVHNAGEFFDPENWTFIITLNSSEENLQNETCYFDFVFNGIQINGLGFSDKETISNTVVSGQWISPPQAGLKINEVYYDVLETNKHCREEKSEWVELYNPTDIPINLKGWQICHGYGDQTTCNPIKAKVDILASSFAVIGHDNSTWIHCFPDVPQEIPTVHQLGGPWPELGNDGDYIILKDPSDTIIDCVSWGNDTNICNFPDGTVDDVGEGHSIARRTAGVDTDTAADWEDLDTPNPGTNPHSLGSSFINGEDDNASQTDSFLKSYDENNNDDFGNSDNQFLAEEQIEEEDVVEDEPEDTSGGIENELIGGLEDGELQVDEENQTAEEQQVDKEAGIQAGEEETAAVLNNNSSIQDGSGEGGDSDTGSKGDETGGSLDSDSSVESGKENLSDDGGTGDNIDG